MRPEIFRRIRYRLLDEQAILRMVTASLGLDVQVLPLFLTHFSHSVFLFVAQLPKQPPARGVARPHKTD